jgi:pimeloyl-ACP methyl ester carboxylesterase
VPRSAVLIGLIVLTVMAAAAGPRAPDSAAGGLDVLDRRGRPAQAITDGDLIRLRLRLPEPAAAALQVTFLLDGRIPVAGCAVAPGRSTCLTAELRAQGWRWDPAGISRPARQLEAQSAGRLLAASPPLQLSPRPVVLVHGFNSNWQTWTNYLGPGGYLAAIGLAGFAVGDGQTQGVMNTGSIFDPAVRTNTIAENARQLGLYVDGVLQSTGAEQVDLVAHSMGGLISRYYIDRVMADGSVAQLITLGTPNAGTDCASLPAALGMLHPATLEIRPSYVNGIFNRQVNRLRGAMYHAVAGTAVNEAVGSPCTGTPSDLIVSMESAAALPVAVQQTDFLHHELNASAEVFEQSVRPLLQTPPGQFQVAPDPMLPASAGEPLQFTRIYTGHVQPGASQSYVINIEPGVSVASFALFDPTRSLTVSVQGASGNLIALDPRDNGLVVVDDPASMLHLGYGFENPRPGAWVVSLHATDLTPPEGASLALTAHLQGGAALAAQADPLLPELDRDVTISAALQLADAPIAISQAQALIRGPDGSLERIELPPAGGRAAASWRPGAAGTYAIDVFAAGSGPDGTPIERTAFLAVEAQPPPDLRPTYLLLGGLGLLCAASLGAVLAIGLRLARRRPAR